MTTTEQSTTPENEAESPADGQTLPPQGNDAGEQENGSEGYKPPREKRYREERNQARAERDALAQRVQQLQTRELERIASKAMSNPADLLTLSGKSLSDFIGENGELDAELVTEIANDLLGSRPGLRPNARPVDLTQGHGSNPPKPKVTWATAIKS